MNRALILTGGIGHPFEDAAPALAGVFDEIGLRSEIDFDLERGIARLGSERFDLVVVYALRWRMDTGEKYAPHRAQWAFSLSDASRATLREFVAAGGALLALHTAIICFDDWAEWKDMIGGRWVWGTSAHPPRGALRAALTDARHAITTRLPDFVLDNDEVYSGLDLAPDITPLLVARADTAPMREGEPGIHPVLWTHRFGKARVVCDLLGHDRAALEHPVHRQILQRSAQWLLGENFALAKEAANV